MTITPEKEKRIMLFVDSLLKHKCLLISLLELNKFIIARREQNTTYIKY